VNLFHRGSDQKNQQKNLSACPAVPRSIPKDSAAHLTGVALADGTGVLRAVQETTKIDAALIIAKYLPQGKAVY